MGRANVIPTYLRVVSCSMATLLQLLKVSHGVGDALLFDGIDLTIAVGDRLGLVGHNGSGKTTLLDLMHGDRVPDAGEITRSRGARVGRVEQFLADDVAGMSVCDAVARGVDGTSVPRWRAEALLTDIGFDASHFDTPAAALSGGEQNRLMFARAVVGEPDLLLLDEPTNHLDLATLRVFERFLLSFTGAFVLVSHDRTFLDAVTRSTAILRDARLYRFDAPYSRAMDELTDQDEAAQRARRAEEQKIDSLKASAKRLATWGKVYDNESLAKRAKSMEKRVQRLESERTFVSEGSALDLQMELTATRSKEVIRLEDLTVTPGGLPGKPLFAVEHLLIRPGERVALLGANGAGKSSLIRMITRACRGESIAGIRVSEQTRLGYYDQELDEADSSASMAEFLVERAPVGDAIVRSRLIAAGFPYRDHGKSLRVLSGGERARVLFVLLSLNRPNFLVLDEPTNHIDMQGRIDLEQQLVTSNATVLITSHDRRFLDVTAQRFLLVERGALHEVGDPSPFYEAPFATPHAGDAKRRAPGKQDPQTPNAEDVLTRIVELEELLAADQSRKPKFQKRKLQAQWRAELARLYERLD